MRRNTKPAAAEGEWRTASPQRQVLTCLLRNLYAGQEATVRTRPGTTDWFQIGKGVRQGCILSPCLFNLYVEYIMRNAGLEEVQTRQPGGILARKLMIPRASPLGCRGQCGTGEVAGSRVEGFHTSWSPVNQGVSDSLMQQEKRELKVFFRRDPRLLILTNQVTQWSEHRLRVLH